MRGTDERLALMACGVYHGNLGGGELQRWDRVISKIRQALEEDVREERLKIEAMMIERARAEERQRFGDCTSLSPDPGVSPEDPPFHGQVAYRPGRFGIDELLEALRDPRVSVSVERIRHPRSAGERIDDAVSDLADAVGELVEAFIESSAEPPT